MVLSFLHGPIRIPMVFILQQDRDRRPRLHHIQRLRRYENWLSCRRLSRRRLSFRQRRGSFPFRRLLYHRPLFYSFLIISLVRLLFTYGRLIHCIKLILPFFFTGRNCLDACSRCALEHDSLNGRIFKDLDIGVAAGRNGHLGSFDKGAANKPHRSKRTMPPMEAPAAPATVLACCFASSPTVTGIFSPFTAVTEEKSMSMRASRPKMRGCTTF